MGLNRTAPPEKRKLARMRQAASGTNRFSIGGQLKKGGHAPRPITLPKTPWDDPEGPLDKSSDSGQ